MLPNRSPILYADHAKDHSRLIFLEGIPAMSKVRYHVAMSLDGYIAGPNGEADWIVMDPDVNFAELWAQFDTLLMGRRTYEAATARLGKSSMQGRRVAVVSRTMRSEDHKDHPEFTIISELNRNAIQTLRDQSRKD